MQNFHQKSCNSANVLYWSVLERHSWVTLGRHSSRTTVLVNTFECALESLSHGLSIAHSYGKTTILKTIEKSIFESFQYEILQGILKYSLGMWSGAKENPSLGIPRVQLWSGPCPSIYGDLPLLLDRPMVTFLCGVATGSKNWNESCSHTTLHVLQNILKVLNERLSN